MLLFFLCKPCSDTGKFILFFFFFSSSIQGLNVTLQVCRTLAPHRSALRMLHPFPSVMSLARSRWTVTRETNHLRDSVIVDGSM